MKEDEVTLTKKKFQIYIGSEVLTDQQEKGPSDNDFIFVLCLIERD